MRLLVAGMEAEEAQQLFGPIEDRVAPEGILPDWNQLEPAVEQFQPEVILLYLGHRPGQALAVARRVVSNHPHVRIVALADHDSPELASAVERAGCADLALTSNGSEDLLRALQLLTVRDEAPTADGQIVALAGAKGGVGTTTVAVNLAAEIASRTRKRVLLVDLHLYLGDAALALDLVPEPTALNYLLNSASLGASELTEGPVLHRAGFRVLGLDGDVSQAERVTAQQVVYLLDRLRERFDYVLLDCGSDMNEVSLAALSAADRRLIVLTNEFRALLGCRRRVAGMKSLGLADPVAHAVLNRDDPDRPADRGAVEEAGGIPVAAAICNAWREVHAALQQGRVLRDGWPKAQVTKDIRALSGFLTGESTEEVRRRAFFDLFGRAG